MRDEDLAYHQFVPAYNKTGPRHIAIWYDEYEGNHLVIARNVHQLEEMLSVVLKKEKHASFKEYWEVDVVLPPVSACVEYAQKKYDDERGSVKHWVLSSINGYKKHIGRLPRGFAICERFDYEPDYIGDVPNEYFIEHHINCKNCQATLFTTTYSDDEIYDRAVVKWRSIQVARRNKQFDGTRYVDGQLYVANADFGHHHKGIVIKPIEDPATYNVSQNDLVFFIGQKKERPAFFNELINKNDERHKLASHHQKLILQDRVKQKELERVKLFEELFPD